MSVIEKLKQFSVADLSFVLAERLRLPLLKWQTNKLKRLISKHYDPMIVSPAGLKILYGPTFPTWGASVLVDKALSTILQLRGATVVPLYCDAVQIGPCSVADEKWAVGGFSKECAKCQKSSVNLWSGFESIKFSEFTSAREALAELKKTKHMTTHEIESYETEGLELGRLARDLALNGLMLETPGGNEEYHSRLAIHFANLKCSVSAIRGALDKVAPDRVVCNDSHYGMWAIMEHESKKREIPFYCQYPVGKNRVSFSSDKPVVWADLGNVFNSFKRHKLDSLEIDQVLNWSGGKGVLRLSNHSPAGNVFADIPRPLQARALLMTNAPWDLASMNRQAVFESMFSWLRETINWFKLNPQFSLYIRPHPIDTNPLIPTSPQTVAGVISAEYDPLPPNVILLPSSLDSVPLKSLLDHLSPVVAIAHTSTAALDCSLEGIEVVCTGFSPYRGMGFTKDVDSPEEYFENLSDSLRQGAGLDRSKIELAQKFVSYYQFRYQSNTFIQNGLPARISKGFQNSLVDSESAINHAVNTIILGEKFHSATNWSPNYVAGSNSK